VPALTRTRRPPPRKAAAANGRDGGFHIADLHASPLAFHHMPGHYIRRLQQVAVALFAHGVDGIDITPVQYAALAALEREPRCDQATLGTLIGYDRATIGGVVDRLEGKGWVAREAGQADRRMKLVSLTARGAGVLRRVTGNVERVQRALMKPLTPAQRRHFERLCHKLLAAHVG
jgi:DNA-binding MarR family transcriptional regulator